ncbi:MAG: hypothetical protein NT113_00160, partial [Hyphomicrobiales bacterium]|nr:hypothetical protein [Hyphomicrobiales bacterium]
MMTKPDTWYVAFGPDRTLKSDSRAARPARATKTFKSETDARASRQSHQSPRPKSDGSQPNSHS